MANVAEKKQAGVPDFILMDKCDQSSFMKNLKSRFDSDAIYTNIGGVIVSVNPYKNVAGLYTQEMMTAYRGTPAFGGRLMPHIYGLADEAYNNMRSKYENQVVIISGESGAGKTEASKVIMNYLAFASGSGNKVDHVKAQLLKSNPVMEAFGNAKTNRNDNSSRFGKYMDIQFNFRGDPVGGNITTYLLEKSRVVKQQKGERNFHIFHQLIQSKVAASVDLKNDPKAYAYIPDTNGKGLNDTKDFEEVVDGLTVLGFDQGMQQRVWSILAGILHLGNIEFQDEGEGCIVKNRKELESCAKLMSTTPANLEAALTNSTIIANMKTITSPISKEKAEYSRDSLAKAIYERLFQWIVQNINKAINAHEDDGAACVFGVLDIYGFEIFDNNGFEQFCINYCNEKLQQLFIELTLKTEQEEYKAEGIPWKDVDYFNNAVICDLIDKQHGGILSILQEECTRPGKTTDMTWLEKLNTNLKGHDRYESRGTKPKEKSIGFEEFLLRHYAGDVTYNVNGFLDKSNDTLFKDLSRAMYESGCGTLMELFPEGNSDTWRGATKRPVTAGTAFKQSMYNMISILHTKQPSYIRCIKPNAKKACNQFDAKLVAHQVAYLGLLENVRVRRAGYCFRTPYEVFLRRYGMTAKKTWPCYRGDPKDGCVEIIKEHGIPESEYALGKTKIFFKSPPTVFKFEELREAALPGIVAFLQGVYRRYIVRKEIGMYQDTLMASHGNVKNEPHYGKQIKWPEAPRALKEADDNAHKVYLNWWARKTVEDIPEAERETIRLKTLGSHFLQGKKKWDLNRSWTSVYVTDPKFEPAKNGVVAKLGDKEVVFASTCHKINRSGGADDRVVLLTDSKIIKLTKDFKLAHPKTNVVPYTNIISVKTSPFSDKFVIIETSDGNDVLLNLDSAGGEELVSEFISRLYVAGGRKMKVDVGESHTVNNSHKAGVCKTISYRKGSSSRLASGKNLWYIEYVN